MNDLVAMERASGREEYDLRYELLLKIASRWRFEIYNKNLSWQVESRFWDIWRSFPDSDNQLPDRKFVLWSLTESIKNVPGDSVECGVLSGASSYIICAVLKEKENHVHHIFDSFEGLSQPEVDDLPASASAFLWKKGDLSVPLDQVRKNLSAFPFVNYYAGWIPDRFSEVRDKRFSFVHIDVDLYQPTRDSLVFFYDRLVPGGVLLCDDYGYTTCPGARKAFDEVIAGKPEGSVIHLPTGQGLIVKR